MAIVVSRYNSLITEQLREGAERAFGARVHGGLLDVHHAPGAYELPFLAHQAASTGRFEGVVALGCIVKGQTRHDQYIAQAVALGLMQASLATNVPCAFGVLTVDTPGQARDRAGGRLGNKGEEAMNALLDTILTARSIGGSPRRRSGASRRGRGGGP